MATPNNAIPYVPENTIDPAAGLNEALNIIDIILQCSVVAVGTNAPPGSPVNGDRHIVGTGTGAFAGHNGDAARWNSADAVWEFADAYIALDQTTGVLWVKRAGTWARLIARDTGWTAGTGTATKGAFATSTATLTEVAERLLAIEQALLAAGIIAA